jgi:hypothetical protein
VACTGPLRAKVSALLVTAVTVAAFAVVLVAAPSPVGAETRAKALSDAAAYGPAHGYRVGISVLDTKTGRLYGAGSHTSTFASESVVKVFIATRILLQGRMHGSTASRAYKMITQSDDAIASSLYGSVGGDSLITWIKKHYNVPSLGSPPKRAGWWGGTYITSDGLVRLYAKLKADKKVSHWLLNAMHHAKTHGSDGFYQYFGIPSATSHAAIKQGWGGDYAGSDASENSTGFINSDRYAVAILGRGPASSYGARIGAMLTKTAKLLLPYGYFPDGTPTIAWTTSKSGRTAGGTHVTIRGTEFTHVSAVMFGNYHARKWRVLSRYTIEVWSPAHYAADVRIRVVTGHGTSSASGPHFSYVSPPTVSTLSAVTGPSAGGTRVTVSGTNFSQVGRVLFGTALGRSIRVTSPTSLQVIAPPHGAGPVHVQVSSAYGVSKAGTLDVFTYVATPTITTLAPVSPSDAASTGGPSSGSAGSPDENAPSTADPSPSGSSPAP